MGTISDKLMRIINTKEDIRQALISKGYDVPTSIPFKEYAKMILDLPCKADSFPDIEGIVAGYSASGITNEQMAANPVWVDKTGNGRDLQLKNFSWKRMPGVGGYTENYDSNKWYKVASKIDTTWTYKSFNVKSIKDNNLAQLFYQSQSSDTGFRVLSCTIKVSGLTDGQGIEYVSNGTQPTVIMRIENDGIYHLPSFDFGAKNAYYGFRFLKLQESCNITIEQLPLYPGFILGDRVDDFAVTEKELNFEDIYTVYTAFIPFQNNPTKNMMMAGKDIKDFYMNYSSLNALSYYSGNKSVVINLSNGFNLLCCKRDADNMTIKNLITGDSVTATANEFINNPGLYYLWRVANGYSYARLAIAGQTICNGYFSTDEDDEKVLDWYKKQMPWLFPDQAWTVTGKTNEDEDRATIANITGNGNNLVLSNFGFAEGSGYNEEGEYAGYLVTDGVDDKIISSIFKMGNDWTVIGDWELINTGKNDNAGIVKFDSIVIYNYNYNSMLINIKNGRNILIPDQNTVNAICSDGRIYSKDWKESIYNEETESTSKNFLTIGYSGNAYTKIAFKNLAIYPTVLSREDCIKAYNYLQTLKAK